MAVIAALLLLTGAIRVFAWDADEDSLALRADGGSTTTATSEAEPTTSMATVTIETSPVIVSTTTTEAPATTSPPATAAPTTAPPPPPPPPATSEELDMTEVLAFAKAGSGGTAPYTYTGAPTCSPTVNRPSDAGDDDVRDIDTWFLIRYCDGVYRGVLATTAGTPALQAAWISIDSAAGGCGTTDHVVIGWHTAFPGGGTGGGGAVVSTPGCEPQSWLWVEPAFFPVYNGSWLQLDFRGSPVGDPSSFSWRGYVQAVGESGSAIDVVPNDGPERFTV